MLSARNDFGECGNSKGARAAGEEKTGPGNFAKRRRK